LIGGSLDWSRDLRKRQALAPIERRILARLSVRAPLSRTIYVRATGTLRDRSTIDPDSLLVDQGVFNGSGEVGWHNDHSKLVFSYTRGMFRDPTNLDREWHRDRFAMQTTRSFGRAWEAAIHTFIDVRHRADGTWLSREHRAESRISWRPTQPVELWLAAARDLQGANEERYDRDQWEMLGGAQRRLFWDLTFKIDGTVFLAAGRGRAESHRLNLQLSRSFSFGRKETFFHGQPLEFGQIRGSVFDDLNADGARQSDEPGIPGQTIILGSGVSLVTDADGSYLFDRASVDRESISLDVRRLPPRYLVPPQLRRRVELAPGEDVTINFPAVRAASIWGRVVGVQAGGETSGLADVLVRVRGSQLDVFTGPKGEFHLRDMKAGTITLEIVPWSLPPSAQFDGSLARVVTVTTGEATRCSDFIVRLSEPTILQHFRSSQK
jgi:hypothetical protein